MTQIRAPAFALPHPDLLHVRATACGFNPYLHGTYSIVILKSGSANVQSSRWSRIVRAGDVFFFNPFEVHAASSAADPAVYETLYPSASFLNQCIGKEENERFDIAEGVLSGIRESRDLLDALSCVALEKSSIAVARQAGRRRPTYRTKDS